MPFHDTVQLLDLLLLRRDEIIHRIDGLLNCQKKPLEYQQDAALQARLLQDCFSGVPGLAREQSRCVELLEQARRASGFAPRANPGNDIIDPAQMLLRGLHLWRQTRWPGQKGRLRYAHTLFNLYLLRCLTLLTLRLWDDAAGADAVAARLARLHDLLDRLWQGTPADQPRLVRDVRWLIPVALSPTTDALDGYFDVAARIARTFSAADRSETQKAWVQTGAGHLCAQLRHLSVQKDVSLDDHALVLLTRRSNALDVALLLEGLVTLLEAYELCLASGDTEQRAALAIAICQGLAPDPELFVERLDLLGPYSMIETVFITHDDTTPPSYTAAGTRHLQLIDAYRLRITRHAASLLEDCRRCRPVEGGYAPSGALYGFSSNLLELIAFKTLQLDAETRYGLEDVFTPGAADKRRWVNEWRRLPHIKPEVVQQFEYAPDFVDAISIRVEQALQRRVAAVATHTSGRLFILSETAQQPDPALQQVPQLPLDFILTSDPVLVSAHKATAKDAQDLLHCRMEGEFLVSYPMPGGWTALDKDLLTDVVGAGTDATIIGLPQAAAAILCLMCPGIAVMVE